MNAQPPATPAPVTELRVSCPRCHSLPNATLAQLWGHACRNNDWQPLPKAEVERVIAHAQREADSLDKPWGYDVEVTFHGSHPARKFHKQGTERAVKRWAMMKTLAKSAEIVGAYTRREWIACYGDGRIRQ